MRKIGVDHNSVKVPSSLTMARFILVSMSLKVALYHMFFVLNLFEIF